MQVHVFRICGQKPTEPSQLKPANSEAEKNQSSPAQPK